MIELYITSILYTCTRSAFEGTRSSRDKSRIMAQAKNRRPKQTQQAPRDTRPRDRSRTEAVHEMGICLSDLVSTWK